MRGGEGGTGSGQSHDRRRFPAHGIGRLAVCIPAMPQVFELAEQYAALLEEAYAHLTLPERVDEDALNTFMVELYRRYFPAR